MRDGQGHRGIGTGKLGSCSAFDCPSLLALVQKVRLYPHVCYASAAAPPAPPIPPPVVLPQLSRHQHCIFNFRRHHHCELGYMLHYERYAKRKCVVRFDVNHVMLSQYEHTGDIFNKFSCLYLFFNVLFQ